MKGAKERRSTAPSSKANLGSDRAHSAAGYFPTINYPVHQLTRARNPLLARSNTPNSSTSPAHALPPAAQPPAGSITTNSIDLTHVLTFAERPPSPRGPPSPVKGGSAVGGRQDEAKNHSGESTAVGASSSGHTILHNGGEPLDSARQRRSFDRLDQRPAQSQLDKREPERKDDSTTEKRRFERPKRKCRIGVKPIVDLLPGQLDENSDDDDEHVGRASAPKASAPTTRGSPRSTRIVSFSVPAHRNFGAAPFPFGQSSKLGVATPAPSPTKPSFEGRKSNAEGAGKPGKGKERVSSPEL